MIEKKQYNYRIDLKPLDYFFFGGEETFGSGMQQHYFAKTRPFPQQTSLLGVLRHYGHENHLGKGKGVDIGSSFMPDCFAGENPFGYIRGISPLFLTHQKEGLRTHYLPGPLGKNGRPMDILDAGSHVKQWNGDVWSEIRQALNYFHKDDCDQKLIRGTSDSQSQEAVLDLEEVIMTFEKIGITKAEDGAEQKDGFYKQRLAKLKENWQFSVLACLDEESVKKMPAKSVLPFGAEKALFFISMEKLEEETFFSSFFPNSLWEHSFPESDDCVLLLSDALVDRDVYKSCSFAITETLDFRSIYTPRSVVEFARFNQYGDYANLEEVDRLSKSAKYNLLRRGSLLYGDSDAIRKKLNERPYYQAIGYNHYTILSPVKSDDL